jgi:hypothetical protein
MNEPSPINRGVLLFLLLAATALTVYLVIANRSLSERLRNAEAALQELQNSDRIRDGVTDKAPLRQVPRRSAAPPPRGVQPSPPSVEETVAAPPPLPESNPPEPPPQAEVRNLARETETVAAPKPELVIPVVVADPDWVRYNARAGSRCLVEATTSASYLQLTSKVVAGQILIAPGLDFDQRLAIAEFPTNLPCTATAVVPVRSLKSDVRATESAAQAALEVERYPNLRYELRSLFFADSSTNEAAAIHFRSIGALTLRGVTKPVEMPVTIEPQTDGGLAVSGSTTIRLTDFGIKSPTWTAAGTPIRAGDQIKITLDWKLRRVSGLKAGSGAQR